MSNMCIIKELPLLFSRLEQASHDGKITIKEAIDIFVETFISIYECETGKSVTTQTKNVIFDLVKSQYQKSLS